MKIDLIGQKFGKLTVIKSSGGPKEEKLCCVNIKST